MAMIKKLSGNVWKVKKLEGRLNIAREASPANADCNLFVLIFTSQAHWSGNAGIFR